MIASHRWIILATIQTACEVLLYCYIWHHSIHHYVYNRYYPRQTHEINTAVCGLFSFMLKFIWVESSHGCILVLRARVEDIVSKARVLVEWEHKAHQQSRTSMWYVCKHNIYILHSIKSGFYSIREWASRIWSIFMAHTLLDRWCSDITCKYLYIVSKY